MKKIEDNNTLVRFLIMTVGCIWLHLQSQLSI